MYVQGTSNKNIKNVVGIKILTVCNCMHSKSSTWVTSTYHTCRSGQMLKNDKAALNPSAFKLDNKIIFKGFI
jgi:hypothetical protein